MHMLEQINDDFIDRVVLDSQAGHPLFLHSMDEEQDFSSQSKVGLGDGSYIGYLTTFSWEHFLPNCLSHEGATQWLDDGVTPHQL